MPAQIRKQKGFTLVELLVVITIIAVLSIIGITVFTSVQKGARDAKRRGDIDAIANAMEVNKTAASYRALDDTWFANGKTPFDPIVGDYNVLKPGCGDRTLPDDGSTNGADGKNRCWYCIKDSTIGYCKYSSDSWLKPGNGGGNSWQMCANLETGSPAYYCKGNAQ